MFVSLQTYHCIQITVRSTVKAVRLFFQNGCIFILTERLCQDTVEEYFGSEKQMGRRNDNLDMAKFSYNNNTTRIQRDELFRSGNIQGKYNKRNSWIVVPDETITKPKIRQRIK